MSESSNNSRFVVRASDFSDDDEGDDNYSGYLRDDYSSSSSDDDTYSNTELTQSTGSRDKWSLDTISTLTKTSSPNHRAPYSIASSCPASILRSIELHWRSTLRRFILNDIRIGEFGKNLKHDWQGRECFIWFDLEIGPAIAEELLRLKWDINKITEEQGLFLEGLVENAQWWCPMYMTGWVLSSEKENERQYNSAKSGYPVIPHPIVMRKPSRIMARNPRVFSCPVYIPSPKPTLEEDFERDMFRFDTPNPAITHVRIDNIPPASEDAISPDYLLSPVSSQTTRYDHDDGIDNSKPWSYEPTKDYVIAEEPSTIDFLEVLAFNAASFAGFLPFFSAMQ